MALIKTIPSEEFAKLPASRAGAKALGVQYYYTGLPCKVGHIGLRYTSSSNCMECNAIEREKRLGHIRTERSDDNLKRAIESIENGNTTYIPKNPCKYGHYLRFAGSNNCVECNKESMRKRGETGYSRGRYYKRTYGITEAEYDQLVFDAYSCCEICKKNNEQLHVDHCHKTGKIRGILCGNCNRALGIAKDSSELLRKMADYLEERANGISAP